MKIFTEQEINQEIYDFLNNGAITTDGNQGVINQKIFKNEKAKTVEEQRIRVVLTYFNEILSKAIGMGNIIVFNPMKLQRSDIFVRTNYNYNDQDSEDLKYKKRNFYSKCFESGYVFSIIEKINIDFLEESPDFIINVSTGHDKEDVSLETILYSKENINKFKEDIKKIGGLKRLYNGRDVRTNDPFDELTDRKVKQRDYMLGLYKTFNTLYPEPERQSTNDIIKRRSEIESCLERLGFISCNLSVLAKSSKEEINIFAKYFIHRVNKFENSSYEELDIESLAKNLRLVFENLETENQKFFLANFTEILHIVPELNTCIKQHLQESIIKEEYLKLGKGKKYLNALALLESEDTIATLPSIFNGKNSAVYAFKKQPLKKAFQTIPEQCINNVINSLIYINQKTNKEISVSSADGIYIITITSDFEINNQKLETFFLKNFPNWCKANTKELNMEYELLNFLKEAREDRLTNMMHQDKSKFVAKTRKI